MIPGAEEVLALLELRLHALSDEWDALVVDCAPTAETLRLLALPEALGWYMTRVFPVERRVVRALRPVLSRAAGVPMPEDDVFAAVERLHAELDEVRALLTGPEAGVRLVLTPEQVVLAEARRSFTTLSLFGYRVDGVVANRVFPDGCRRPLARGLGAGPGRGARARWASPSRASRSGARSSGRPSRSDWPSCATSAGRCTPAPTRSTYALRTSRSGSPASADGAVLRLRLPFVDRGDVDLARDGDDLVVTVASYRRLLTLPAGLARRRVAGARVDGGELQVRFAGERGER